MNPEILVVGSLNMDLVVNLPRLPQRGETLTGSHFATFPGGKGANQAVAAARAGGRVSMLGSVGADDFGQQLLESLHQSGVATEPVSQRTDVTTGVALITVDEHGENTIVVVPGANGTVSVADLNRAESLIAEVKALVLQLEIPIEAVDRAVTLAKKHHIPVVLNAAPAAQLSAATLDGLAYLIVNETELELVSGVPDNDDLSAAGERLLARGVQHVVVTLGARGVYVHSAREKFHLPAHTINVVDSTAAGDAFAGAFTTALVRGAGLREAAAWGNAAGALAVSKAGAQPSLPTRAEIIRCMDGEVQL
jgi:ribokinase